MKRLVGMIMIIVAAGCSSSASGGGTNNAKPCGAALDAYHLALIQSDDNLTDDAEKANQRAVVDGCGDAATFRAMLKGSGYDYTKGPGAIAFGDPDQVWHAFGGK